MSPSPCVTPETTLWITSTSWRSSLQKQETQVGAECLLSHQENTSDNILPAVAQDVQPGTNNADAPLHRHRPSSPTTYAAVTAKDKGRLQHIIHAAEKVIGCNLPFLWDLHTSRTLKHAATTAATPTHSILFQTLAGGCGFWNFLKPHKWCKHVISQQYCQGHGFSTWKRNYKGMEDNIAWLVGLQNRIET